MQSEQDFELIKKILQKQDELNILTNGVDWRTNSNLKWYRAIWTECAELIDYTNWKWWKKETISYNDIKMEVIDILHFTASEILKSKDIEEASQIVVMIFDTVPNKFKENDNSSKSRSVDLFYELETIRHACEELAENCLIYKDLSSIVHFVRLCKVLNLNIQDLYKLYMAKNILNRFRQDHGYKVQTYMKMWDGQEDNVYLMNNLNNIKTDENFETNVYNILDTKYRELLEKSAFERR
jgi:dimeric dUTPase (all-alpha-NTP-PPase superfamily)